MEMTITIEDLKGAVRKTSRYRASLKVCGHTFCTCGGSPTAAAKRALDFAKGFIMARMEEDKLRTDTATA